MEIFTSVPHPPISAVQSPNRNAFVAKTFGGNEQPIDREDTEGLQSFLPQSHSQEKVFYEVGKRLFFQRGGAHDFSCASCHGQDNTRIRLQDLPNLTKNPGDGVGFAAWPAYRVSNGQMWGMQQRLNDCYRQQRFPYPGFGSDATIALGVYLGVNSKGSASIAPAIKR